MHNCKIASKGSDIDEKSWVWFSLLDRIPLQKRISMLLHFGEPDRIMESSFVKLNSFPGMDAIIYSEVSADEKRKSACLHLKRIKACGLSMVTFFDDEYPELLRYIQAPPIILYVYGQIPVNCKMISIVGSRKCTSYGEEAARQLSSGLAGYGYAVVSGLARGIDTYAHEGALAGEGKTVAVLACGLDLVYPAENRKLLERIKQDGAVISEYVPGTPPMKHNFPARNRIISGMSVASIIVEAGAKSGSLITASYALEQGRDVFAVPGNITSPLSIGTNRLIKDGAAMANTVYDIISEIEGEGYTHDIHNNHVHDINQIEKTALFRGLDKDERKVAIALYYESMDPENLSIKTGIPLNLVLSSLLMLELKGLVESLPGKVYTLKKKL